MAPSSSPLMTWVASLPAPAEGHVRLYRIQTAQPVPLPAWVVAEQHTDGTAQALGRWFTRDPQALEFYAQEWDHPELVTLDLPQARADACRLDRLPAVLEDGTRPRSFSRDHETEHFVAVAQLAQVHRRGRVPAPVAPRRRLR